MKIKRQKSIITLHDNENSATISARPRVINICKIYNIGSDSLLAFLESKGYNHVHATSLLDKQALDLIEKEFQGDKMVKDRVRGKTDVEFIHPATKLNLIQQPSATPKEEESKPYKEPVLHLTSDLFNKTKQIIDLKKFPTLHSKFTDTEAINICSKMSSSFTRNLCKQLNSQSANRQKTLYQIHHIANKALSIFGSKMLTFIYGLRNINFKNRTAVEIKTYKKVIPDFPIISFKTGATSFKISFFVKQTKKENQLKPDVRLFASDTYQEIGAIDEAGYVLAKLGKFKPQLGLFYEATKNKKFEIFSGVESGNCEICGRELSHPQSLRIGIGPVCAYNKGIDRTIYHFR